MIYKTVYEFQVMAAVRDGHNVFILDRKFAIPYEVKNMTVADLAGLLNEAKAEPERFDCWYVEEGTE